MYISQDDVDYGKHIYNVSVTTMFNNGATITDTLPARAEDREMAVKNVLTYLMLRHSRKNMFDKVKEYRVNRCAIKSNLTDPRKEQEMFEALVKEYMTGDNPHAAKNAMWDMIRNSGSICTHSMFEGTLEWLARYRVGALTWKYNIPNVMTENSDVELIPGTTEHGVVRTETLDMSELKDQVMNLCVLANRDVTFFKGGKYNSVICTYGSEITNYVPITNANLKTVPSIYDNAYPGIDLKEQFWLRKPFPELKSKDFSEMMARCQLI